MVVSWGVAHVFHIESLSEFPPNQIQKTWWQASDYAQMFNENAKLLDEWMIYGRLVESNDETFRGLEQMTQDEVQRRKRLRDQAVDAVLDEQDRQYEEENLMVPNPEGVARVYAPMSQKASRIAHRRGLQDEEDASSGRTTAKLTVTCYRRVHFCPMVHVQTGLHLSDYTPSEVKRCWFSEEEVKILKAHSKEVIKALLKCITEVAPVDNSIQEGTNGVSNKSHSKTCYRGLEPYLLSNKIGTRQQNVRKVWDTVFKEQDRQDAIQACLPAHIAQISRDTSYPCFQIAQKLAQQDQRFVKKYLSQEITDYSIQSLSQPTSTRQGQRNRHLSPTHTPRDSGCDSLAGVAKAPSNLQSSTDSPGYTVIQSSSLETPPELDEDNCSSAAENMTERGLDEVTAAMLPSSPEGSLSSSIPSSPEADAAHVFQRLKALSLSHSMDKEDKQSTSRDRSAPVDHT